MLIKGSTCHEHQLASQQDVHIDRLGPVPHGGRLRRNSSRRSRAPTSAGAHKDVLRVWRNAGAWERAVGLAKGDVRVDLDWLIELERLVERRPAQQNVRLRNGERDRIEQLLDVVQKWPPRKRGKKDE